MASELMVTDIYLLLIWITAVLAVLTLGAALHEVYAWLQIRRKRWK